MSELIKLAINMTYNINDNSFTDQTYGKFSISTSNNDLLAYQLFLLYPYNGYNISTQNYITVTTSIKYILNKVYLKIPAPNTSPNVLINIYGIDTTEILLGSGDYSNYLNGSIIIFCNLSDNFYSKFKIVFNVSNTIFTLNNLYFYFATSLQNVLYISDYYTLRANIIDTFDNNILIMNKLSDGTNIKLLNLNKNDITICNNCDLYVNNILFNNDYYQNGNIIYKNNKMSINIIKEVFNINNNGFTGINIIDPKYQLDIYYDFYNIITNSNNQKYFYDYIANPKLLNTPISINSNGSKISYFNDIIKYDSRNKVYQQIISKSESLFKLYKLNIYNYEYIAKYDIGSSIQCGFDSVEVKSIIPEATNVITDYINSPYKYYPVIIDTYDLNSTNITNMKSSTIYYKQNSLILNFIICQPYTNEQVLINYCNNNQNIKLKMIGKNNNEFYGTCNISTISNYCVLNISLTDKIDNLSYIFIWGFEANDFAVIMNNYIYNNMINSINMNTDRNFLFYDINNISTTIDTVDIGKTVFYRECKFLYSFSVNSFQQFEITILSSSIQIFAKYSSNTSYYIPTITNTNKIYLDLNLTNYGSLLYCILQINSNNTFDSIKLLPTQNYNINANTSTQNISTQNTSTQNTSLFDHNNQIFQTYINQINKTNKQSYSLTTVITQPYYRDLMFSYDSNITGVIIDIINIANTRIAILSNTGKTYCWIKATVSNQEINYGKYLCTFDSSFNSSYYGYLQLQNTTTCQSNTVAQALQDIILVNIGDVAKIECLLK
jgi:hypothetical protein